MWAEHLAYWAEEPRGHYTDLAEFARYIVEAFKRSETNTVQHAFNLLERFVTEGDSETQTLTTIGLIEDIQNIASLESFGYAALVPFLGPNTRVTWAQVEQAWAGKKTLADVIRSERN